MPAAIEIARENARFSGEQCLAASAAQGHRNGELLSALSTRYHTLGVVALLADADPLEFARLLALSGQVDLHCRELDLSALPRIRAASRWIPFADALAAGDLETAREIARLSPDVHQEGFEYEDDFLRYRFMHVLLIAPEDEPRLRGMLQRWEAVATPDPTAYHALSVALLARDADAFGSALQGVLERRRAGLAAWRKTPDYRVEFDATEGGLFVLGLAYLRLAALRGLPLDEEYEGMPSLARVTAGLALPAPGAWRAGIR